MHLKTIEQRCKVYGRLVKVKCLVDVNNLAIKARETPNAYLVTFNPIPIRWSKIFTHYIITFAAANLLANRQQDVDNQRALQATTSLVEVLQITIHEQRQREHTHFCSLVAINVMVLITVSITCIGVVYVIVKLRKHPSQYRTPIVRSVLNNRNSTGSSDQQCSWNQPLTQHY